MDHSFYKKENSAGLIIIVSHARCIDKKFSFFSG